MIREGLKLVTVVVPVYNVEKHIVRCIDSILAQTYSNLELILVDDGSTDNSGKLCDKYIKMDSRVSVIHTPNRGVSKARNEGIERAKGDYLLLVDSDDWVEPDHIENFMPVEDEDLVYGGLKFFVNGKFIEERGIVAQTVKREDWISNFSEFMCMGLVPYFINCCFDMKIIKKNKLRYNTGLQISEEGLFNLEYMKYCNKIRYTSKCTYCYEDGDDTSNSLSHRFQPMRTYADMQKCIKIEELTQKKEYLARWKHWCGVVRHFKKWIHFNGGINKKEATIKLRECYKNEYFRECIPYIRQNGSLDEKIETYFMFIGGRFIYRIIYNIIAFVSKIKNKLVH